MMMGTDSNRVSDPKYERYVMFDMVTDNRPCDIEIRH